MGIFIDETLLNDDSEYQFEDSNLEPEDAAEMESSNFKSEFITYPIDISWDENSDLNLNDGLVQNLTFGVVHGKHYTDVVTQSEQHECIVASTGSIFNNLELDVPYEQLQDEFAKYLSPNGTSLIAAKLVAMNHGIYSELLADADIANIKSMLSDGKHIMVSVGEGNCPLHAVAVSHIDDHDTLDINEWEVSYTESMTGEVETVKGPEFEKMIKQSATLALTPTFSGSDLIIDQELKRFW